MRCRIDYRLRGMAAVLVIAVMAGCQEDAHSPTAPAEPASGPSLATAAAALSFYQMDGGNTHSCGLTTDNRAYCWGDNSFGQLGDGSTTDHVTPRPVLGGLRFRQISAGWSTTCAVTTEFKAYCWGESASLGGRRTSPTPVATTVRFRQIEAGIHHTCAVGEDDRRAYCWGGNDFGQLGEGSRNDHDTPLAVAGTRRMREVHVGDFHTCAVTTGNVAFCWGWNKNGQVGQSTLGAIYDTPVRVRGGLQFRNMTAGNQHNCGVTTADRVYCWGRNSEGQLGDGTRTDRSAPKAVATSVLFDRVTGGLFFTCAESQANTAYCWGANNVGQGGNGTSDLRTRPFTVDGGLKFAQVNAGWSHACGKTPDSKAYCWGWNPYGQVGDGTTTNRFQPVAVAAAP